MSQKILVVGATGNVGSSLVKYLAEKGEAVKAATRRPDSYPKLENVEAVKFDYDQPETYTAALEAVDRVFLLSRNADVHADQTLNPFVDKAKAMGVNHIVLMTAMGVDQAGEEAALRRAELYLINSGVSYTILRPNWFMQNFNPGFILPMLQQGDAFYLPAADAKTSLIDTRDIAAVAALALTEDGHKGQEYPLTGPEALSYDDTAKIISEVSGRDIQYVAVDDDALRQGLSGAGWTPEQVEMMVVLFQSVRQGWAAQVLPTVSELLGRDPITFEQFAKENAEAWK